MFAKKSLLDGKNGIFIQFNSLDEYKTMIAAMKNSVTEEDPITLIQKIESRFSKDILASYILASECDQMFSVIINILATSADNQDQAEIDLRNQIQYENKRLTDALTECCRITNEVNHIICAES